MNSTIGDRDRVLTNTTPVAALYYDYDRHGNLTNLLSSTANGVFLAYEYDALNRVTNVIDNRLTGTKDTAYSFDLAGNLKSLKYPNGVLTNLWEYDARNRLTNLVWKQTTTTRGSFYYELAVAGNRTNLSENVNGTLRTNAWRYDQLYRLTNEVISGLGAVSYGYDRVSNRTNRESTISQLSTTNYVYNTNDWLTSDIYDENGNTRTNGSNIYLYDWANRLTNSGLISVVYNADGHRIQKTTATTTTLYLVDDRNLTGYPQVLEELTVSGSITNLNRSYIYGLDLIGWHEGALLRYYGYDGHGSVRFMVNGSGTVGKTYTYDAYGTVIASSGSSPSVYRYAGEEWDEDLGLYFLRARYLNANSSRFWTMDRFEGIEQDSLTLNKYLYANANPVNRSDPSGFFAGYTEVLTVAQIEAILVVSTLTVIAATTHIVLGSLDEAEEEVGVRDIETFVEAYESSGLTESEFHRLEMRIQKNLTRRRVRQIYLHYNRVRWGPELMLKGLRTPDWATKDMYDTGWKAKYYLALYRGEPRDAIYIVWPKYSFWPYGPNKVRGRTDEVSGMWLKGTGNEYYFPYGSGGAGTVFGPFHLPVGNPPPF